MDKDKQMSFLFEEGGITDDGLDRDPVSGNEVPSGSMAKEVRDDIPAQLSEGEYVVPADVVRYYGVKYFEELRDEAKMGLGEMEAEGRIGGEPIDMDDAALTIEEEAELNAIMGMAIGGDVPMTEGPPQAIGNTYQQVIQEGRGYEEGGVVPPSGTQVGTDFSNFAAGYSFMGDNPGSSMPTVEPTRNITLYGPNGEVVNLILPAQNDLYNQLIAAGYSEQPIAQVAPEPQQPANDDGPQPDPFKNRGPDDSRFGNPELTSMMENPLDYGRGLLEDRNIGGRIAAGVAGLVNPVLGIFATVANGLNTRNNVAEARASALMAERLGFDSSGLTNAVNERLANPRGLLERAFLKADDIENRAQRKYQEYLDQALDIDYGGGIGRDNYAPGAAGDLAFTRSMEETAPSGMQYNPDTGGYTRTGSAAPTSSPTPTMRPRDFSSRVSAPSARPTTPTQRPSTPSSSGGGTSGGTGNYNDNRAELEAAGYTVSADGRSVYSETGQVAGQGWSGSRTVSNITGTGKQTFDIADNGPSQSGGGGFCFLTTAMVDIRGEDDDGPTLTTLRSFRDTYLKNRDGEVQRYYEVAPKIVAAIPKEDKTWDWIGGRIDKSVEYIKLGKKYEAYKTYKRMVEKLERDWLTE